MADMQELIARLEAAEAGSRELDALVHVAVANDPNTYVVEPSPDSMFSHRPGWYRTGADLSVLADPVTTSLDAALALAERVLPLHDWSVGHLPVSDDADHEEHHSFGCLFYAHSRVASPSDGMAHGATPALAVVTAILKAKAQGEGG